MKYKNSEGVPASTPNETLLLKQKIEQLEKRLQQAEALRSDRQRRLLLIVRIIPWEADANTGQFTYVGPQAEEILGYPVEQWYTENFWSNHIHPEDREKAVAYCIKASAMLDNYTFEYRMITSDGRQLWLHDIVTVERENGVAVLLSGYMIDVSEHKHQTQLLQESEAKFKNLIKLAPVGIFQTDRKGDYIFVSEHWTEITGFSEYDAQGKGWLEAIHPSDRNRVFDEWNEAVEQIRPFILDYRFIRPDGTTTWVLGRAEAMSDTSGRIIGFLGAVQNINELKTIEEERERILTQEREARIQSEKLVQVRDDFISIVSHELSTPLTALKMQFQMIPKVLKNVDFFGKERFLALFNISLGQFEQFSKLVEDLLDISRIKVGRMVLNISSVSLSELIKRSTEQLQLALQSAGCPLHTDLDNSIEGQWDPDRIQQVIIKLLSNSLKYGAGKPIRLTTCREGPHAKVTVRDFGMGISEEDRTKIFQRFGKAVPVSRYGGLGLGLYMAQQIVQAHGGTIHVESDLDKGSAFIVKLPLSSSP
jgi:PAS domain S-box-containing protein